MVKCVDQLICFKKQTNFVLLIHQISDLIFVVTSVLNALIFNEISG